MRAIWVVLPLLTISGCGSQPQQSATILATAEAGNALLATYQEYTLLHSIAEEWVQNGTFGEDTERVRELLAQTDALVDSIRSSFDINAPYRSVVLNRAVVDTWLDAGEQLYAQWKQLISAHFEELPIQQRMVVKSFDQNLQSVYAMARNLIAQNTEGENTLVGPQTVDAVLNVLELALRIGLEVYRRQ